MTVGEYITKYLAEKQMSLGKLSEQTGISKATLSLWRRGLNAKGETVEVTPDMASLKKLASGTGVTIDQLVSILNQNIVVTWDIPAVDTLTISVGTENRDLLDRYYRLSLESQDMIRSRVLAYADDMIQLLEKVEGTRS